MLKATWRFLLSPRLLFFSALACVLFAGIFLNVTGYCYSQMRYVPDEEILIKTLDLDWQKNMERVADRNLDAKSVSVVEFVRSVSTWGRVNGRLMKWKILFWQDPTIDTPRRIYRIFGIYEVLSSLTFDSRVGKSRYLVWFRSFDRCGETTGVTQADEDDQVADDQWNGQWRRAHGEGDKIGFDMSHRAGREDR